MKYSSDLAQRSKVIIEQVKEAERLRKPIDNLVREQIEIIECQRDEFIKQADNLGYDELGKARAEIQMISVLKYWAQKIGLPVDKYDARVKDIRVQILGEELASEF